MINISFEENKKLQLDILSEIADFCDEHNLRYFLTYGSLIGAVRHHGFIPWDDDIDIQMPREDYNVLIKTFNQEKKNSNYELIAPGECKSRHSIVKIIDLRTVKIEPGIDYSHGMLGIDVDIFPIDGMPSDEGEYLRWRKQLFRYYRRYDAAVKERKGSIKHIIYLNLMSPPFVPAKFWLNCALKLHKKYPYKESEFVGTMEMVWNGTGNRVKKSVFDEEIEAEFEGRVFKIPKFYDELLTALYGDYMELPPKEKQITHHKNNVFWKDT